MKKNEKIRTKHMNYFDVIEGSFGAGARLRLPLLCVVQEVLVSNQNLSAEN